MLDDTDLLQDQLEDAAVTPQEESPETPTEENWDKARQAQDQKLASVDKKVERLAGNIESLGSQLESKDQTIAALQYQLAEKKAEKTSIADGLDADVHGEDMVSAIKGLEDRLDAEQQAKNDVQEKLNRYESDREVTQAQTAQAEVREEILSDLDDDYGAKYRTEAVKRANAHVAETNEVPENAIAARKLMKGFYRAVKAEDESKKGKSTVQQDNNRGGLNFNEPTGKEGDINTVLADMKKSGKYKGAKLPGPD